MDPLPAEWRTFGEHPTGAARSTGPRAEGAGVPPETTGAGGHRFAAIALFLAGVAGLSGIAVVAWASQPAEVLIGGSEVAVSGIDTGPGSLGAGSGGAPGSIGGANLAASPGAAVPSAMTADVVVDVEGAVMVPGLQRLAPGTRVGDAIAAAGGFSPRVDAAAAAAVLNLAEPLSDGIKIHVPARGAAGVPAAAGNGSVTGPGTTSPAAPAPSAVTAGLIDLNLADSTLLDTLPGIGPVTAAAIIAARTAAPFTSVEELRTRGVVGPATYEGIRALVTVGG
ncbi:MAG: helix-hairpin-helix domain-containing protein [Chloroflexota bacterium]|nr:helix-hairpin-helix domain-containing protein [Chloroflexota bacterium]